MYPAGELAVLRQLLFSFEYHLELQSKAEPQHGASNEYPQQFSWRVHFNWNNVLTNNFKIH